MTNIYDIISLNGEMYMVDDSKDWDSRGSRIYRNMIGGTCVFKEEGYVSFKSLNEEVYDIYPKNEKHLKNIVASTDKSLGLPLLPEIKEEEWDKNRQVAFSKFLSENQDVKLDTGSKLKLFNAGYKAASSKEYTEEDMENAYDNGANFALKRRNDCFTDVFEAEKQKYIKSLTPPPIQVEVEMEDYPVTGTFGLKSEEQVTLPRVDSNNTIIVKRYIYGS